MTERNEKNLKRIRCRIAESHDTDELTDADHEALTDFDSEIDSKRARENKAGPARHFQLLYCCYRIAKGTDALARTLKKPPAGKEAIDDVVDWLQAQEYADTSIDHFHAALHEFARLSLGLDETDDLPDRFAELSATTADQSPVPSKADVIRWHEVTEMIDARAEFNYRDPAMLAIQWSTGARPESELHALTWGDVEDKGTHFLFSIPDDTKTGSRDIDVYTGAPYLRLWREHHPANDDGGIDDTTPLWTKLSSNEAIGYTMYYRVFRTAADEVGLSKPPAPRNYRRSRASVLASRPSINQVDLENHFGWKRGSDAAAHYITAFAGETGKHVAMADGHPVDEEEQPPKIAPVQCVDCGEYTPRHRDECLWCPAPLEASLGKQSELQHHTEDGNGDFLELLMDGEVSAADLRSVQRLEDVIRKDADKLLGRTDELIRLAEGYEQD